MSNLLKFLKLAFGMLSSFVWVLQLLKVFLFLLRGFHWVFLDRPPPRGNRPTEIITRAFAPWFLGLRGVYRHTVVISLDPCEF